jgi:hypothetical protein
MIRKDFVKRFAPVISGALLSISFFIFPLADASAFASNAVEQVSIDNEGSANYVSGLTSARVRSLGGAVIAIISIVIGLRARARQKKNLSKIGIALGCAASIWSIIHLASNTGAFGTGGGKAGAIVSIVLGTVGIAISLFALRRSNNASGI